MKFMIKYTKLIKKVKIKESPFIFTIPPTNSPYLIFISKKTKAVGKKF